MALAPTALLKNVKGSIRKFLYDNLKVEEGIEITFDRSFEFHSATTTGGINSTAKKWIDFTLLNNNLEQTQRQDLKLTCVARGNNADSELIDLRDLLMKYLTNPDSDNGFKTRRIIFYATDDADNLVPAGYIMLLNLRQSASFRLSDNTKYMIITAEMVYDSRI